MKAPARYKYLAAVRLTDGTNKIFGFRTPENRAAFLVDVAKLAGYESHATSEVQ